MDSYTFIYKCRMCGKEFGQFVGSLEICSETLNHLTVKDTVKQGIVTKRHETHNCDDLKEPQRIGFSDLIGIRKKE